VLIDCADPPAAAAALRAGGCPPLEEVVPGASTLLAVARRAADLPALADALVAASAARAQAGGHRAEVQVPVRYDGADLEAVAAATSSEVDAVIAAHTGATYRGAFSGFAPGFCYLTGLPAGLRLPRRAEPRPRVPAGSVAIAESYSAVYPRATPGGWWLLGTTPLAVWDPARTPPALIRPGALVRFVAAG
jgi:KipI family sensor histidine kinase inhibitor